jgi:hypothetical protein
MTAPSRRDPPVPADVVQVVAPPGAPGWEGESEAPAFDAALAGPSVRDAVRQVARLAGLKGLVARFEARHRGHRVGMAVAHGGREDAHPRVAPRWLDSFFEP